MRRRLFALGLALLGGCVHHPKTTVIEPELPSQTPGKVIQVGHVSPATEGTAVRVANLGRKIEAANPEMGIKPMFQCLGVAEPTIFHRLNKETCEVWISEGLVNQCQGESQLAAVLCQELGKAASEKAALSPPPTARLSIEPPPEVPVGNDCHGSTCAPVMVRMAELARVDQARRRRELPPPPPPPPEVLARAFLQRAGYAAADLQAVTPLLRAAEQNTDIEKQLTGKLH